MYFWRFSCIGRVGSDVMCLSHSSFSLRVNCCRVSWVRKVERESLLAIWLYQRWLGISLGAVAAHVYRSWRTPVVFNQQGEDNLWWAKRLDEGIYWSIIAVVTRSLSLLFPWLPCLHGQHHFSTFWRVEPLVTKKRSWNVSSNMATWEWEQF